MSIFQIEGIEACYEKDNDNPGYCIMFDVPQEVVKERLEQVAKTVEDFDKDDLEEYFALWASITNEGIITEVWLNGCNDQHYEIPVTFEELKEIHLEIQCKLVEYILEDISMGGDLSEWNNYINNLPEEAKKDVLELCLAVINQWGTDFTLEDSGYIA